MNADHSAKVSIDGKMVSKQTKDEVAFLAGLKEAADLDTEDAKGPEESYFDEDLVSNDRLLQILESWMVKHNKLYASSGEKLKRFEIYGDLFKMRHLAAENCLIERSQ